MSRKKANFVEMYLDKIIFAGVGAVCVVLLGVLVFGGSSVEYNGTAYGPGQIDERIKEKAQQLSYKIDTRPNNDKVYASELPQFEGLLSKSIKGVKLDLYTPLPRNLGGATEVVNKVYRVPNISDVYDVNAAMFRMVAYEPTEEVSVKRPYEQVDTEAADMDFITVEAKFDVGGLYDEFYESFVSDEVRADWRDEALGTPIFAKVELQRQRLGADGVWGQWQQVSKTRISHLKETLDVPENVNELELGIDFLLVQFSKAALQNEVLQPGIYDFAYPAENWMSPEFFKEEAAIAAKEQQELERQRREEQRRERAEEIEERRRARTTRRPERRVGGGAERGGGAGGGFDMGGVGGAGGMPGLGAIGGGPARGVRRERPIVRERTERTIERRKPPTVRDTRTIAPRVGMRGLDTTTAAATPAGKFEQIRLTAESDLSAADELVFWAHDDTAEPGGTYRYRIRIGVFNPIAGQNWFAKEYLDYKDKVVLWSRFSEPTESIEVPQRWYVFAKNVREVDKTITVEVARYFLGQWRAEDFRVRPGDMIGKKIDSGAFSREPAGNDKLKQIDYTTGAIVVDIVRTTEWAGVNVLKPRDYPQMLYSYGGDKIEYLAIGERYWADDLQDKYEQIQAALEQEPIVLRERGKAGIRPSVERREGVEPGGPGGMPGMFGPMMMPGGMPMPGQR